MTECLIFVVGNRGAGRSTFVELATSKPSRFKRVVHALSGGKQSIKAASYQSKRTILVDTPGFDDAISPDRNFISKVGAWTNENYGSKGNDLKIAIVFLHNICDNRFSDERNPLHTICALAQKDGFKGRITKVVCATSMWSGLPSLESRKRAGEREDLFKEKWNKVEKTLGNSFEKNLMRFEKTSSSVEEILQSITH